MVSHVHGRVDQDQKHFDVYLVKAREQLWISAHEQGKRLTVRKFVITPLKKPLEDRMETTLRVPL